MRASSQRSVATRADQAPLTLRRLRAWPSAIARHWVSSFAKKVCADDNTLALVAIGSLVRNVAAAQDVDLVYIYKSKPPDVFEHPLDVDVRVYDGGEVPGLIAGGHDLLGWAMRYGVLICEHDEYWSRLGAKWHDGTPLPDPAIAETRASRAEAFYRELRRLGDRDAAQEQLVSLLTHRAWARLLRAGVYPASRPELGAQLRGIGDRSLARKIDHVLSQGAIERLSSAVDRKNRRPRQASSRAGSAPLRGPRETSRWRRAKTTGP